MNNNQLKNLNKYLYIAILIVIVIIIIVFFIFFSKKNIFELVDGDITLKFNEEYIEPGYKYIDKDGKNITDQVVVNNNVNVKIPGEYEITYQYGDNILKRKVTVLEPSSYELSITYQMNTTKATNEDITIYYKVNGETFDKVDIPNEKSITQREGNFKIVENGTYKITAYNTKNDKFEEEIVINNIDKEKPTGKCQATLKIKNTEYNVDGHDNKGIVKYDYYDGKKLLTSSIINNFETTSETGKELMVKVYDEAGNYDEIKCEIIDKSFYEPIVPPPEEKIVFKGETDTLKVYITNKNSYYITRIWTRDAYSQLNKAVSPEYGVNLYKPLDLLKKEMSKENLYDKLIVGFNASGFYLKNIHDKESVEKYSDYNKTSVGTIVINNGVVFRNAYNHADKQWYLTGITRDNKMVIFEDNVAITPEEITEKQKWSQTVIDSGIRNTLSFAGPVILNGKKLTTFSTSMPRRDNKTRASLQLMCQINENNFVLYTSILDTRQTAIEVFLSLGCQTAINLDGGGSVALLYKDKYSTVFKTLHGGDRALPEAGYFTE